MPIAVHIAVEDDLSEAVLRRLLDESRRGYVIRTRYPTSRRSYAQVSPSGFGFLKKHLAVFNRAAPVMPFVVLTDLDQHPCPATLASTWHPRPLHPNLMFRVAVREVESWLLSDAASMAEFLQIPAMRMPADPESLADPKAELVALARLSRSSEIREGLAPAPASSARVGPYFRTMMIAFAKSTWDLQEAKQRSESLRRAMDCFRRFQPSVR